MNQRRPTSTPARRVRTPARIKAVAWLAAHSWSNTWSPALRPMSGATRARKLPGSTTRGRCGWPGGAAATAAPAAAAAPPCSWCTCTSSVPTSRMPTRPAFSCVVRGMGPLTGPGSRLPARLLAGSSTQSHRHRQRQRQRHSPPACPGCGSLSAQPAPRTGRREALQRTLRKDFVGSALASHLIRGSASGNRKHSAQKMLPRPAGSACSGEGRREGTGRARRGGYAGGVPTSQPTAARSTSWAVQQHCTQDACAANVRRQQLRVPLLLLDRHRVVLWGRNSVAATARPPAPSPAHQRCQRRPSRRPRGGRRAWPAAPPAARRRTPAWTAPAC